MRLAPILAALAALGVAGAARADTPPVAVGPQYDSSHVYVAPADFDSFVASFVATFGGSANQPSLAQVTPTPSQTAFRIVSTPVGMLSVFAFKSPIPYPFGSERDGYLVSDMDAAVAAARADGAEVVVDPFPDAIGRDALLRWPGGVGLQLYWHTKAPSYAPLASVPENRVYVSKDSADAFVRAFLAFSHGQVLSDDAAAPGVEIGRPGASYRRVRIASPFGRMVVLVTDGQLPWPYGRETTGYEVSDLAATLAKASAAGATIVVPAYASDHRDAALVQFPGGYIAEIHAAHP
jgi:hypothetical protein